MNWKMIFSKTTEFILIVGFVIIFKSIFGNENTLIGVTTITAMLLFLGKDLTVEPIKNTIGLIIFNLLLGIFAYLSVENIYLGIILNFISIFIAAFSLSYNLKNPAYVPFTLQYLFMLATPVDIDRLPFRLLSLFVGAIAIMLIQFVANRNRVKKYGDKILGGVCILLLNKIKCIEKGEDYLTLERQIINSLYSFEKIIYDNRKSNFFFSDESRIKINLSLSLNKLNSLLNDICNKPDLRYLLDDISIAIENIKICLEDEENLYKLEELFNTIYEKYRDNSIENVEELKILNIISFINKSLIEIDGLNYNTPDKGRIRERVPLKFRKLYQDLKDIKENSLRFSFAFRFAVGVAIGAFISDFFALSEGRWIFFTIAALSQPHYELSMQKGRDRIFATILGTIIISILFTIITDDTLRALVIVAAGYIGGYIKEYKYNLICVTVSAVGSASLLGGAAVLSVTRVMYVIIGMIIAMVLAKFVLPYRMKDANNDLLNMYKNVLGEMMDAVKLLVEGNKSDDKIDNLLVVSSLIEDKLTNNNSNKENNELNLFINKGREVNLNIFILYQWIQDNKISRENITTIVNEIKVIIKNNNSGNFSIEEELTNKLEETTEIRDKVIINNIIEIFLGLRSLWNIKVTF